MVCLLKKNVLFLQGNMTQNIKILSNLEELQDCSSKLTGIGFSFFPFYSRKKEDHFLCCSRIAHKALFKGWGKYFILVDFHIENFVGNIHNLILSERKENVKYHEPNFVKTGKIHVRKIKRIHTEILAFVFSGY